MAGLAGGATRSLSTNNTRRLRNCNSEQLAKYCPPAVYRCYAALGVIWSDPARFETLQVALYYGAKFKSIEKTRSGSVRDNFEFVKVYSVACRGRNAEISSVSGALLNFSRMSGERCPLKIF